MLANHFLERNSWVPGVGVAVALFALTWLFNLWLRYRDKETKTFDYRVLSDIPIFTEADRPEDLTVTYKGGIDISDPRVTLIRFKNTGKKEIRATDFEEDYRIERGSAGFIDYKVIQSSRPAMELASLTEIGAGTPEYIKFRPKTLNRDDWFTIQIFFDGGANQQVSVLGSVAGETRPTKIYLTKREKRYVHSDFMWGMIATALTVAVGAVSLVRLVDPWPGLVFISIGLILALRSIRQRRRRLREVLGPQETSQRILDDD